MLNKLTIIGIIIGSGISILGAASMVTSLNSPNEIQEDTATFGVGGLDKINFNAPENSSQSLTVTGASFDIKITTPDSSNDVDASFKDKASFSWTSNTAGQTIIAIQNTGDSEFTENYKFELARDPLFFTYSVLVIIAGVVVIGFSAGFSAKKPKGF
ncbi:MAG: hypothetical protein HOM82_03435 [Thaumarchaeota archaeon]|jgi:hypothetical protein|nr:hypothetical protein [Nitrososphaerota archaeon]MBT3743097.1 hypothetical protein [Nitrososphaerota archaeon]MBT4056708.1 hypothetical protein [Nitrososphaerota archaeon]MBT4175337.1 hypothetical protein [Nitrososphaerota archaeon]MBT4510025.1 hypothetical protein [Nitrososphaerota archaeon]